MVRKFLGEVRHYPVLVALLVFYPFADDIAVLCFHLVAFVFRCLQNSHK